MKKMPKKPKIKKVTKAKARKKYTSRQKKLQRLYGKRKHDK